MAQRARIGHFSDTYVWNNKIVFKLIISDYEDHAHMTYFMKNRERIQSIQDPIAQSRYLPWHKNYSSVSHDYLNLAGWYQ